MTEAPRILAGRYEVGRLIGRGGMADVHLGTDTRLGRDVAIKILRSELARDPSFLQRFRREAKSAASLNHPSIVAVFDSGEDELVEPGRVGLDVPFIVMEYVPGRTLRDILYHDGPLEPSRAARIMIQVLQALHYSHEHGVVHRDVKPANVMISDGDVAKVMDFGIARAIADTAATMTNTSIVVGTAQYLSPEQAQGRDIDARSDLYSAACLLYELLTGRPPFVGDSPVAVAYQHVGQEPQPPSGHAPDVPSDLDAVLLHALAKSPDDRYATCADFAADLEAVLRRQPTVAAAAAPGGGETTERLGARAISDPSEAPTTKRSIPWVPILVAALVLLGTVLGVLASRGAFDRDPDPVAVPGVVGRTEAKAKADLSALGLTPARQPVKSSSAAGTVVGQSPAAGTLIAPASVVRLSVSTGPGMVEVPNLRNYQQDTASQQLSTYGLGFGGVRSQDSAEIPQGGVIATAPKMGTKVPEGTKITLIISSGQVTMPDVVGDSQSKAADKLNQVALRYTPTLVDDPTHEPGTVVAQSYKEGQKVPQGTVVDLSIVRPRQPSSSPTPSQKTVTVTQSPSTSSRSETSEDPTPEASPTRTDRSGTPTP